MMLVRFMIRLLRSKEDEVLVIMNILILMKRTNPLGIMFTNKWQEQ